MQEARHARRMTGAMSVHSLGTSDGFSIKKPCDKRHRRRGHRLVGHPGDMIFLVAQLPAYPLIAVERQNQTDLFVTIDALEFIVIRPRSVADRVKKKGRRLSVPGLSVVALSDQRQCSDGRPGALHNLQGGCDQHRPFRRQLIELAKAGQAIAVRLVH